MTPPLPWHKLRAIVDGEDVRLTPDEAKAIHLALWNARSDEARAKTNAPSVARLNAENDALVAQVLAEERRACVLALQLAEARELLRAHVDGDARRFNPRGLRRTVVDFLSTPETKSG